MSTAVKIHPRGNATTYHKHFEPDMEDEKGFSTLEVEVSDTRVTVFLQHDEDGLHLLHSLIRDAQAVIQYVEGEMLERVVASAEPVEAA